MRALRDTVECESLPSEWAGIKDILDAPQASTHDSWTLVSKVYSGPLPTPCCYQGALFPDRVQAVMSARKIGEKSAFRMALARLRQDLLRSNEDKEDNADPVRSGSYRFTLKKSAAKDFSGNMPYELQFAGKPVKPPADMRALMASIAQDLGEISDEYLVPAGPGTYTIESKHKKLAPADVRKGVYHEEGLCNTTNGISPAVITARIGASAVHRVRTEYARQIQRSGEVVATHV